MAAIVKYFIRGVLVLIPILVTIYVVWLVADKLEPAFSWVGGLVAGDTGGYLQTIVGVVVTVSLITVVGFLATNFLGARLVALIDTLFDRVPLIRLLHGSIKDLLNAFVGDKKSFDRPVLVALTPDGTTRAAGFVTRDDLEFLGAGGHVAVYLPQSYNFAGNLVVVPADRVEAIATPSSDVMAFLVSGGVSAKAKKPAE